MSERIRYRGCDLSPYSAGVAVWSGERMRFCAPSVEDAEDRLDGMGEEVPPMRSGPVKGTVCFANR